MKNLFLASYFSAVSSLLPDFYGRSLEGVRVVFIPTASNVEKITFYIGTDKKALAQMGCEIAELDISTAEPADIEASISSADIIFVDGGNTFYLLQELRRTGADKLILEHIRKGKAYVGASAGSMILCPDIEYAKYMDDAKAAPELRGDYTALSVVDFSLVPHCQNFPFKKAAKNIISNYSETLDIKAIHNKQVVIVKGNRAEFMEVD